MTLPFKSNKINTSCSFRIKNVPRKTEYVSVNITIFPFTMTTEAVAQRCSVKKVFLEISENSQENTCACCVPAENSVCFPVIFRNF